MRHTLAAGLLAAGFVLIAAPAFAVPAITSSITGFSAGPGTDYGPAPTLQLGTHVDVIWCGTHQNWCLVDIHNKRGWVPMASLNFKLPKVASFNDDGTSGNDGDIGSAPLGGGKSAAMATQMRASNNPPPMINANTFKLVKIP